MNIQFPKPDSPPKHRNFTIVIGWGFRAGADRQFGIRKKDSARHLYIIGKTGMGKSSLVENVCIQLIYRGQGCTLVDPHGDSIAAVLSNIPTSRIKDTIHISLADTDFPIRFNPLAEIPASERATKATSITRAIANIWRDSWGERSQYILQHAILSLLYTPNSTLLDVNRLFDDEAFRERVTRYGNQDPSLAMFWKAFHGWSERYRCEAVGPLQNKLGQLLMHPTVRNILCQRSRSFDARSVMDTGKIVLVNLAKGAAGHDAANLVGSILVSEYEAAAFSRSRVRKEHRRHHWLIIDEFTSITTEAFASMLSEIRKYNIHLILLNQHLEQVKPIVRNSIFGNIGSLIVFQSGASDARLLAAELGWPEASTTISDLSRFEVVSKLMEKGETLQPFLGKTMGPINFAEQNRNTVIEHSRTQHCSTRHEAEEEIRSSQNLDEVAAPLIDNRP